MWKINLLERLIYGKKKKKKEFDIDQFKNNIFFQMQIILNNI